MPVTDTSLAARHKALEREIQKAEVEKNVREKQLAELRPKRAKLETETEKVYGVSFADLGAYLDTLSAEIDQALSVEEARLIEARQGS